MFIHEIVHILLSLAVGLIFAYIYRNWRFIILSFLPGLFLDVDHLIDYFLCRHGLTMNIKEFLSGTYFDTSNKVYLFLHGYEYALLAFFVAIIILINKNRINNASAKAAILLVMAISLFLHLVYDEIYYQPKLLTYSIIYRASHNFEHDSFGFTVK